VTYSAFPNFSLAYFLLLAVGFLINLLIAFLVGNAARSKDRSFASFFWLSFFMGFFLPALVVAALPFRADDPRRPENDRIS
jgi:hypothetical protein